jgi:hypothetical protein
MRVPESRQARRKPRLPLASSSTIIRLSSQTRRRLDLLGVSCLGTSAGDAARQLITDYLASPFPFEIPEEDVDGINFTLRTTKSDRLGLVRALQSFEIGRVTESRAIALVVEAMLDNVGVPLESSSVLSLKVILPDRLIADALESTGADLNHFASKAIEVAIIEKLD